MSLFITNKPLYGFTTRAPHAKRRIHLFRRQGYDFVFFRPRNAPSDWMGTFWGDYPASWSLYQHNWSRLEHTLRPHLAQSHIWRVFYMNDPSEGEQRQWRIVWRPDFGYVECLDHSGELTGAYFWPRRAKFNLWRTPTRVLQQHFEREWYDPQSDVRVALLWCDMPLEERDARAVLWKRGCLQELERLIHSSLQLLLNWEQVDLGRVAVALAWNESGQHIEYHFPLITNLTNIQRQLWRILQARIEEHNRGTYDLPNGNRVDWVFPWVKYESPRMPHRYSSTWLEIRSPSQHERMEASLFLRGWLRDHAPGLLNDWFPNGV